MRVIVNGIDVTGRDAYIDRADGWFIKPTTPTSSIHATESDWSSIRTISGAYTYNYDDPTAFENDKTVKIKFYKNVPLNSDSIKLQIGGYGWSIDGIHQSDFGNQVYATCILKEFI